MALAHDAPDGAGWLTRVLTTDFCPWANRFVYWLKEPVGWFALATLASVIVGLYLAPIGWTIAACLLAIIVVGMAWPWIAVRAAVCSLRPEVDRVHEDEHCHLTFAVRNRLPLPLWGMAVEGYLDRRDDEGDADQEDLPTVALAYVRGLSICSYRFAIQPSLRGRYPNATTSISCSFPFGIWTARRPLEEVTPVTVWPKIYPIAGRNEDCGQWTTLDGEGSRRDGHGDFIGIREYRIGDRMKHINWVSTARADRLIVTERGAPENPAWDVVIDVRDGRCRDEIADQVRVAASILANLHSRATPIRLCLNRQALAVRRGDEGFVQMMDALADVPIDGTTGACEVSARPSVASITISTDVQGNVTVCMVNPDANGRLGTRHAHHLIDRTGDLALQMKSFWSEKHHAEAVA